MAKFKVGDKVELLANPYAGIGNVVEVTPVGTIKAVFPERSGDTVNVFLERDLRLANSCRSRNAVVAKALNATRVARNGYVDIYTIAKQEWKRAYRGNEPFGVDAEIKPNGDFKIQEVAHGKVDDSEVDWKPIAEKVKRALLAAGNKSAVVKLNPYGNGITGNLGIARNACGTARNAGDRDMYEDAIRQAIVKCEAAIKYEPDADDYSDVTRLVKQAKDILAKAYRAI